MASGRADHARGGGRRASTRPRSTSCCTRPSIPRRERDIIGAGLPASPGAATGEIVFSSEDAEEMKAQGPQGHPGAHRDQPRGHPRHACRRRHPDHARRHDQPCGRGGARHGQALRFRRRLAARRLPHRHADGDGRDAAQGRRHHHRRRHRPGAEGRGADAAAGTVRRFRDASWPGPTRSAA